MPHNFLRLATALYNNSARAEILYVIANNFHPGCVGWDFIPVWNSSCNHHLKFYRCILFNSSRQRIYDNFFRIYLFDWRVRWWLHEDFQPGLKSQPTYPGWKLFAMTWRISAWAEIIVYKENFSPGLKSRREWMEIIVSAGAEHDYMRNFQPG